MSYFRFITRVDISGLQLVLSQLTDADWEAGKVRQEAFENHKDAPCIPLKWGTREIPDMSTVEEMQDWFRTYVDTFDKNEYSPYWDKYATYIQPVVEDVLGFCGLKNPKVARMMLANLPAGAHIPAHGDGGKTLNECMRIHVPITSNPKVMFRVMDEYLNLAIASAYEIDNAKEHEVWNKGKTDRVHLIIDAYSGDDHA